MILDWRVVVYSSFQVIKNVQNLLDDFEEEGVRARRLKLLITWQNGVYFVQYHVLAVKLTKIILLFNQAGGVA